MPDKELTVNLESAADDLTFEDMEDIENLSGHPIGDFPQFGGQVSLTAKMLRALAFIALRGSNPGLTFDDVKKIKVGSLGESPLDEEAPNLSERPEASEEPRAASSE